MWTTIRKYFREINKEHLVVSGDEWPDPTVSTAPEEEDEDDEDHEPLDQWDEASDYGYADSNIIGTEEWEDQKGMEQLKAQLKLDPSWFLVKVVNFTHNSLLSQIEWLDENCKSKYKRVGWSSSCSTKVGIAFEDPKDAFFYKLRWR